MPTEVPLQRVSFYDEIARNKRNSWLLVVFVTAIILALVGAFGYLYFPEIAFLMLVVAFVFVLIDVFVSFQYGDQIVLRSVGAVPADDVKHRYYVDTVEGLAIAAGIPKPKIYVMQSPEINAFATGKDPKNASVCVTTGALEKLSRQELEGVLGHEMSHIANYDIRFAMLLAVLVGLVAILSYMFLRSLRGVGSSGGGGDRKGGGAFIAILVFAIVLAILAPFVTRLAQASASRQREFLADASGARLTRYPEGLAGALTKIKKHNAGKMDVNEAVSHLFFQDPTHSALDALYATHPNIDERIKKLQAM